VDWMLFPGPPEACFYGLFPAMQIFFAVGGVFIHANASRNDFARQVVEFLVEFER
jgi:hypothetical protein